MYDDSEPKRMQVLSLDGGGVRGIFQAAVLAQLEADLEIRVARHFDLIVGTSTGGIIALGLSIGLSPSEILDFYLEEQPHIFSRRGRLRPGLLRAKYAAESRQAGLERVFGDRRLRDCHVPVVIPSFDLVESDVYLFKTPHHVRLRRDRDVPLWQVAMATSAAPTFFPVFCLPRHHVRLIDGGVWANNPCIVGVTEAVSMFGRALSEINLFSLGTTAATKVKPARLDNGGILAWGLRGAPILNAFLDGQSRAAFAEAEHLLGATNAARLDPIAPPELVRLDRGDAKALLAKAAHHSRKFAPLFAERFADHTGNPLQSSGTAKTTR
jgi:uncharacterized protein